MRVYAINGVPGCGKITFENFVQERLGLYDCIILPAHYFLDKVLSVDSVKDRKVVFINCENTDEISRLRELMTLTAIFFSCEDEKKKEGYDILIDDCVDRRERILRAIEFMEEQDLEYFNDPLVVDLFGEVHIIKSGR